MPRVAVLVLAACAVPCIAPAGMPVGTKMTVMEMVGRAVPVAVGAVATAAVGWEGGGGPAVASQSKRLASHTAAPLLSTSTITAAIVVMPYIVHRWRPVCRLVPTTWSAT